MGPFTHPVEQLPLSSFQDATCRKPAIWGRILSQRHCVNGHEHAEKGGRWGWMQEPDGKDPGSEMPLVVPPARAHVLQGPVVMILLLLFGSPSVSPGETNRHWLPTYKVEWFPELDTCFLVVKNLVPRGPHKT